MQGFGDPQGSRIMTAPPSRATPTTSMIVPSGEDANPLNRRLPAEVVTRQRKVTKAPVQDKPPEDVQVDLRTALALKPDARPKWLSKAFKMAEEGKASRTELYDILTSRKFAAGLPQKVGRKLHVIAIENAEMFSEKQQRYFRSDEWVLSKFMEDKAADEEEEKEAAERETMREQIEADKRGDVPKPEKKRDTPKSDKASKVPSRLAGAFDPVDKKEDKRPKVSAGASDLTAQKLAPVAGSWTTEDRQERQAQEAAKRTKREAFEHNERNALEKEAAAVARARELQQEQAKKRQVEEEARRLVPRSDWPGCT